MSIQQFAGRLDSYVARFWLPIGWVVLLTGLFWAGDRGMYTRLFYWLMAAPALIMMVRRPCYTASMLQQPIIAVYALFGLYVIASIGWSSTDNSFLSAAKRPVYVFLLLIAAGMLARFAPNRVSETLEWSAWIAAVATLATLGIYVLEGSQARLTGYGALYNPLLSSHVYGFFWTLWLSIWIQRGKIFDPIPLAALCILGLTLYATGSRTPIVATFCSVLWLGLIHESKWKRYIALLALTLVVLVVYVTQEQFLARGLSHRPEIWMEAWQALIQAPWFGHGYDAEWEIVVPGLDVTFADPHNISLAVLYYTGVTGFLLWVSLYGLAFTTAWRHRRDGLIIKASALLVFGLAASMTEGGAFISRPKEHWFLIWIPFALLLAAKIRIECSKKIERAGNGSEPSPDRPASGDERILDR